MNIDEKLDLILNKIDSLGGQVQELNQRVGKLEEGMKEVAVLSQRVGKLEEGMKELNQRVDKLEKEMKDHKTQINRIEMILQNETNKNIMIVAENHLELTRKLSESIAISSVVDNELRVHKVFLNRHETELNKLIAQIAEGVGVSA